MAEAWDKRGNHIQLVQKNKWSPYTELRPPMVRPCWAVQKAA
jgi:hypothetical protein